MKGYSLMSDLAVRLEELDGDIMVLVLDDPAHSANTTNERYLAGMDAALMELRSRGDQLQGVIVTSARSSFFAGGDLAMLQAAAPGDETSVATVVARSTTQLRNLETLGVPVVAAIAGSALGGGLEIALACHHRIMVDSPASRVGFPEVSFGLLPATNGLVRTVRMLGLRTALSALLLSGATYSPAQAKTLGIVDELIEDEGYEALVERAHRWIVVHPNSTAAWDVRDYALSESGLGHDPAAVMAELPPAVRRLFDGFPMPAPRAILDAACACSGIGFEAASRLESAAFVKLACGQISSNLIQARFFDMQTIRSGAARPSGFDKTTFRRAAVIGAGMMGCGIAQVCAESDMDVVLIDRNYSTAERGKGAIATSLTRGDATEGSIASLLQRITPVGGVDESITDCELIIEAVFEDQLLKQSIYHAVDAVVDDGALIASNTSTLPIAGLAGSVRRPGDFLGLHFFSPVPRMQLVEVIAGNATESKTLAKGIDAVLQLNKIPIVVSDSRGFFTSRVIVKRLIEAMAMVLEGIDPHLIESAAVRVGYPVGPLTLLDELTISLVDTVRRQAREADELEGKEWVDHAGDAVASAMVHTHGRVGKASGGGFYSYENGRRGPLWPGLADLWPTMGNHTADSISDRLLFAEVVDAFRCLDEGVLRTTADANVGSLLGIGFPAWTGGVIQFAKGYPGGLTAFEERTAQLAQRFGERFALPLGWSAHVGGADQ